MFFPVPDFKGFDFFPHNLRLPFMRFKGICLALSIIAMAALARPVFHARPQLRRRLQGRLAHRSAA